MAWITRITVAAVVLGVFLAASIATQGSPAKSPTAPDKARSWVLPDTQRMFPLRKLDPKCTGEAPVDIVYGSRSDVRLPCVHEHRVQPHVVERHTFDTNA